MQSGYGYGYLEWVGGWISATVLLAVVAWTVGPGPVDLADEPMAMIRIEGGSFRMGSEDGAWDERPIHTVSVRTFEIDQLPVKNNQFAAFLNSLKWTDESVGELFTLEDPSAKIALIGEHFMVAPGFEQYPVTGQTWIGARAYCAWRGARLPTEAEWERAARGVEGRKYPWGNEPPDASRARFGFRLFDYVAVGRYPAGATPEGVLDLAGNVWEWTSSLYRPYPYRADDGREDPSTKGERVTRGGGHNSSVDMLRASFRSIGMRQLPPGGRPPVGFRCARDV